MSSVPFPASAGPPGGVLAGQDFLGGGRDLLLSRSNSVCSHLLTLFQPCLDLQTTDTQLKMSVDKEGPEGESARQIERGSSSNQSQWHYNMGPNRDEERMQGNKMYKNEKRMCLWSL